MEKPLTERGLIVGSMESARCIALVLIFSHNFFAAAAKRLSSSETLSLAFPRHPSRRFSFVSDSLEVHHATQQVHIHTYARTYTHTHIYTRTGYVNIESDAGSF